MGLDMYLDKHIWIGAEFGYVKGAIDLERNGKKIPIDFNKVSVITETAIYWRKSNAIHKWFVDNVQDGEDDCKTYYVEFSLLTKLHDTIKKILSAKTKKRRLQLAEELLPTQEGFFFGSTGYDDDYYFEDLKYTMKELEKLDKKGEYFYHSSW